jgi:FAD/FMN-containing dehydrogenase/Fe-S oxidoreductase
MTAARSAGSARATAGQLDGLAGRLRRETSCEVLFDPASRGRYSTDASIYQIEPLGVAVPRTPDDALGALAIAEEEGVPILPRGAGTSQCGQTVGAALVIDSSKYLDRVLEVDVDRRLAVVEPGVVLDRLNAGLRPLGLWFPVDVSTSAQATLGGMAGNNSCGSRSIRYGNMVHNVAAIDAWLPGGRCYVFAEAAAAKDDAGPAGYADLIGALDRILDRDRDEIAARWPTVLRRVQGYNVDMVLRPGNGGRRNLAQLLVGSEGTLGYFRSLTLKLAPLPGQKVLGVCHFPTFYAAMDSAQHIVRLDPDAVELVDRTMIGLARGNATFRPIVDRFLRGEPDAILLVEFAGDERQPQQQKLARLGELLGDLGFPGAVVDVVDAGLQRDIWEVRKAGLNIMMSMRGDGKPVSFIEDCAVPLEHLAEYTRRIDEIFARHGTRGTWYAHASVGTLHVRPVLDMKSDGARQMRAIAEEACALVRRYKGAYSGEHGDGLVRSEWIEPIIGARLARSLAEVKSLFDPRGLMNPGKIVAPSRMDDRSLFRFRPGHSYLPLEPALDWSDWRTPSDSATAGFAGAVEMCNNNGHCRKYDGGTMCPSYRATRDEQHLTRGRANTLRLAVSGQLGPEGIGSQAVRDALELCVSCKGCRRECPTGVDVARMKIEVLHRYHRDRRRPMKDLLVAYLPRYASVASRFAPVLNLRNRSPRLRRLTEALLGISARRSLPPWHRSAAAAFADSPGVRSGVQARASRPAARHGAPVLPTTAEGAPGRSESPPEVALLVDTFTRWFEPGNADAAVRVLQAAGYRVRWLSAPAGERPLCCGRTFLAAGMVKQARDEASRLLRAAGPLLERGVPIVGLEPSCLFGLRDEFLAMGLGEAARRLAGGSMLLEEFLVAERGRGRARLALAPVAGKVLLHGHCHQKAFGAMPAVEEVLRWVPGLAVETVTSSCCGMAGAFGFDARHFDLSMKMAEASLLPAIRAQDASTCIAADGTSCRHQILDATGREALHVVRILDRALRA